MDIDRIIGTNIPDIAPVYGGVRGRTMSSRHQAYAWPVIVEAGVKRIIDLRDCDASDKLPEICAKYGLEYFHYPVNNQAKQVESMVKLMPQFCRLIDEGDFYIACAMGLHRTDIALCTYWVFYGADKGILPPPIRGYRKEDGHNTNKIMHVLNAIYAYLTELNGVEPMPLELFKERKQTINALSKEEAEKTVPDKQRIYIDMGGVLVDFRAGIARVDKEVREQYIGRVNEIPGVFKLMPPMPGAIEAMKCMRDSGKFDMYILTTSPWKNPSIWADKVEWIDKYLGDIFCERLIQTHKKELLLGDIIIDDSRRNGAEKFQGEWIHFGSREYPDWESVLKHLKVK